MEPIYLDYNATTPVAPEVAETMRPYLDRLFGNPSSVHSYGVEASQGILTARKQLSALLNCRTDEIIFTSGGTESNNYALKGAAFALRHRGNHIITTAIEHPAIIEVCRFLEKNGFRVSYLPVDEWGRVNVQDVEKTIEKDTILVSVMHSNNEVGTLQDIAAIAAVTRSRGIVLHTDASQSVGKVPIDVQTLNVDLLTIAGHKLYAPKGVGALYIRTGVQLEKFMHGANHETDRRAGTENIMHIAALGAAAQLVRENLHPWATHAREMTKLLWSLLSDGLGLWVRRNGHPDRCLPNTLSVSFKGIQANTLLSEISNQVAASAGAACHSDKVTVSTVLQAMNVPLEWAMGTIRFSTGRYTTRAEIEKTAEIVIETVERLATAPAVAPETEKSSTVNIKLTHYTHGLGCACKMRPQYLERVLRDIPSFFHPDVLVGNDTADDAAVYRLSNEVAIVQTVDFFTPVTDNPFDFGAIAAANALSDIYAMGARPLFALNIVGFPDNRLPMEVLKEILRGAAEKAKEAGIPIVGGHTITDNEPKFGMCVTGIVHPDKILRNSQALPGDALILTKPLGLGIINTAIKREAANDSIAQKAAKLMKRLNNFSGELLTNHDVKACTDITGFGLLGHLKEMAVASQADMQLFFDQIPFLGDAFDFALQGLVPGGTVNNLEYVHDWVQWDGDFSQIEKLLLADAQTSGGLLIAVPGHRAGDLLHEIRKTSAPEADIIGYCTGKGKGLITVKRN